MKITCSKCGKALRAPGAMVGKRGKCPRCGHVFNVPAKERTLKLRCSKCGKALRAPGAMVGKRGKCPRCGHVFDVPAVTPKSQPASPAESCHAAPAGTPAVEIQAMEKEKKDLKPMSGDLKGWGVGLLIMGTLHFVLPFLATAWGIVLITLGILALVIRHRGMYIAVGGSLIVVGILNITSNIDAGIGFWRIFGFLQIYWGIKEMIKFSKYGKLKKEILSANSKTV